MSNLPAGNSHAAFRRGCISSWPITETVFCKIHQTAMRMVENSWQQNPQKTLAGFRISLYDICCAKSHIHMHP